MADPSTGSIVVNANTFTEGGYFDVPDGAGNTLRITASELGASPYAWSEWLEGWPDVGEEVDVTIGGQTWTFEAVSTVGSPAQIEGNYPSYRDSNSRNANINLAYNIATVAGLPITRSVDNNISRYTRDVAGSVSNMLVPDPAQRGYSYTSASVNHYAGRDVFRFNGRDTADIAADIAGIINASASLGVTATVDGSTVNLTNDTSGEDGNVDITTSNIGAEATVLGMANGGDGVANQTQVLIHELDNSGNITGKTRAIKSADKPIIKPDEMEVWLQGGAGKKFAVKNAAGDTDLFYVDNDGKGYFSGGVEILGGVTEITTTNSQVTDPMILLAKDNDSDAVDIGFVGAFDDGTAKWGGIVRDADDGIFKVFSTTEDLDATNVVNTGAGGYALGTIMANISIANEDGVTANTVIDAISTDLSSENAATSLVTAAAAKAYADSVVAAGTFDALEDTNFAGPADNDVAQYDNASGKWVDRSLADAGIQAQADFLDNLAALDDAAADGEFLVATGAGTYAWESGADARASLGLVIGTDVQAADAELSAIAGLTSAANKLPYFTGSGTADVADFTAAARDLLDDADASAMRTTLGLAIGSDVQAYNAGLADIAGLAVTDGNIIVGDGANWVAESGGTARASLGLAIGSDVQAFSQVLADLAALSGNNKVFATNGSGAEILLDFSTAVDLGGGSPSDTVIVSQAAVKAYIDAIDINGDLGDLDDVTITDLASGELLAWNGSAWVNRTIAEVDAELGALAGLTSAADALPYFTGSGTADVTTLSAFGRTLIDDADASAARTTLGVVIGTDVQAQNDVLDDLAALAVASEDEMIYASGSGTFAYTTLSGFGRDLIDDADAAAARGTLGLDTDDDVEFGAITGSSGDFSGDINVAGDIVMDGTQKAIKRDIGIVAATTGDWAPSSGDLVTAADDPADSGNNRLVCASAEDSTSGDNDTNSSVWGVYVGDDRIATNGEVVTVNVENQAYVFGEKILLSKGVDADAGKGTKVGGTNAPGVDDDVTVIGYSMEAATTSTLKVFLQIQPAQG